MNYLLAVQVFARIPLGQVYVEINMPGIDSHMD